MDSSKLALLLFLSSLFIHTTLGEIVCEELPTNVCSFSISSSGKRCLVETAGKQERQCRTSEVVVDRMSNYIETDECVSACGVDRNAVGISSDSLLEPQFTSKLCSSPCFEGCPNIVDLYYNLAAGEAAFLPDICEAARENPHRSMVELMSTTSGVPGLAPAPFAVESKPFAVPESPAPTPTDNGEDGFESPAPTPKDEDQDFGRAGEFSPKGEDIPSDEVNEDGNRDEGGP